MPTLLWNGLYTLRFHHKSEVSLFAYYRGDPHGRPRGINRRPSPSTSVGARAVGSGREGLYGRPRPVPLALLLGKHDHLPTPRATIKALPTPHHPPSPLRIAQPPTWLPGFG